MYIDQNTQEQINDLRSVYVEDVKEFYTNVLEPKRIELISKIITMNFRELIDYDLRSDLH